MIDRIKQIGKSGALGLGLAAGIPTVAMLAAMPFLVRKGLKTAQNMDNANKAIADRYAEDSRKQLARRALNKVLRKHHPELVDKVGIGAMVKRKDGLYDLDLIGDGGKLSGAHNVLWNEDDPDYIEFGE